MIYICCTNELFFYISDFARSFISHMNAKLLIYDLSSYEYDTTDYFIFIQKVDPNFKFFHNVALINIEQLAKPEYKEYIEEQVKLNIPVFDFSMDNISLMNNKTQLIKQLYDKYEMTKLTKYIGSIEKIYDVAFIGHLSEKRKRVYDDMSNNGLHMLHVNTRCDDERDQMVAQAKVLLNVHYDKQYNTYETLRCDRWALSGMLVLSEESNNQDQLDTYDLITFSPEDQLVENAIKICKNYDEEMKKLWIKIESQKESIFNNRLQIAQPLFELTKQYKHNVPNDRMEIYSEKWNLNHKVSYVKYNSQYIKLKRGFNIIGIKDDTFYHLYNFDSCLNNYVTEISTKMKELYYKKEYDSVILITHDDAVNNTDPRIINNNIFYYKCTKLSSLGFRGTYLLFYDIRNNRIIDEICDNDYSIIQQYSYNNKWTNLGERLYFVSSDLFGLFNNIDQLNTQNIVIVDNHSRNPQILEYYKSCPYEIFRTNNLNKVDYPKMPRRYSITYGDFTDVKQLNLQQIIQTSESDQICYSIITQPNMNNEMSNWEKIPVYVYVDKSFINERLYEGSYKITSINGSKYLSEEDVSYFVEMHPSHDISNIISIGHKEMIIRKSFFNKLESIRVPVTELLKITENNVELRSELNMFINSIINNKHDK